MQDKIIAAIAAYLEENIMHNTGMGRADSWVEFQKKYPSFPVAVQSIATEIAAAIAPLVAENDLPLSELFTHMSDQHNLTLTDTELVDIIQVSRGK